MGILTRKQGADYVIGSDRNSTDAPTNRAPKGRSTDKLAVWTGDAWSAESTDALTFATLEDADEYVRANFSKVTAQQVVTQQVVARPKIVLPVPPVTPPLVAN